MMVSRTVLATRVGMILRDYLMLLLFFHVNWLGYEVHVINLIDSLLIIIHEQALRIDPTVMNDILSPCIMPIEILQIVTNLYAIS
jgi:hypothetical protein